MLKFRRISEKRILVYEIRLVRWLTANLKANDNLVAQQSPQELPRRQEASFGRNNSSRLSESKLRDTVISLTRLRCIHTRDVSDVWSQNRNAYAMEP
jgi:hypothetical protein